MKIRSLFGSPLAFIPLAIAVALAPQWSVAGKLYKWVDESGNISYQDSPPPEGAEFSEKNVDGVATGVVPTEAATPSAQLAAAAANAPIVLYSIADCDGCELFRSFFNRFGIPFDEKDVESDIATQTELKEKGGRLEVPTVFVGEKVMRGYNRGLLENILENAGFPALQSAAAEQPAAGEQGDAEQDEAEQDEAEQGDDEGLESAESEVEEEPADDTES
ncbi:MAG: glutaredoxin family protein [Gammaproteobacteria bacterium]|nr:glutaredoxin family protein [Gammaproteobacteria bacterium]